MYKIVYKYKSAYNQDIVHSVNCVDEKELERVRKQIEIIPGYEIVRIEVKTICTLVHIE